MGNYGPIHSRLTSIYYDYISSRLGTTVRIRHQCVAGPQHLAAVKWVVELYTSEQRTLRPGFSRSERHSVARYSDVEVI